MLAATVNYDKKEATIGTETGQPVSQAKVLEALELIGYSGEFIENH